MGMAELLIVLVVILLVFGPKQIPELINQAKRLMTLWHTSIDTLTNEIENPPAPAKEKEQQHEND